jgi:hypothetical protein
LTPTSLAACILRASLRAAGVEFTNHDRPGVRLKKVAVAHFVKPANAPIRFVAVLSGRSEEPGGKFESKRSVRLATTFISSSTPIAVMPVTLSGAAG